MNDPKSLIDDPELDKAISHKLIDVFIRVGLIGFLVTYCVMIFKPFVGMMLWSIILAVAFYPLQQLMVRKMKIGQGRAATGLVLAVMLSVIVPAALLAVSFADSTTEFLKQAHDGTLQVPPPNDAVARWPFIGPKLHDFWALAHEDVGSVIAKLEPKLGPVSKEILGYAASAGTAVLMFLVSLLLSGIWMAYADSGKAAALAIAKRTAGEERGEALIRLSTATIRAVAQGVIGIACVQALLLGAGFIMVGIPAAGILSLGVLLLGIMQIPALLITLPTMIYVFSTNDSTPVAVMFAIYSFVAGSVDNILKPLMLGRGVDAPMPVILLGALGGMATGGIIGLFLGSVMLALGYQLFMAWVYREEVEQALHEESTGFR